MSEASTAQPAVPAPEQDRVEAAALAGLQRRLQEKRDTGTGPKVVPPQRVDFAAWADRLRAAARQNPQRFAAPAPAPSLTAADVRKGWYIPKRFRRCVLDLCPAPVEGRCRCDEAAHYVAHTRSQLAAQRAAVAWAERCGKGEGLALALVGGVGTGKSHLMYAAIARANDRGVNAGAWGWGDLADILRGGADRDPEIKKAASEARLRLKAVGAMGLDEIRATSGTEYDGTAISNIMTRAYRDCQDVIVTSNHADDALKAVIGLAATSRLKQMTVVGPDYRQKTLIFTAA